VALRADNDSIGDITQAAFFGQSASSAYNRFDISGSAFRYVESCDE
jgi:hypothetical protein